MSRICRGRRQERHWRGRHGETRVPAVFGERSGWIKGEGLEVAGLDVTRGQGWPKRGQRPGPQAAAGGGPGGSVNELRCEQDPVSFWGSYFPIFKGQGSSELFS